MDKPNRCSLTDPVGVGFNEARAGGEGGNGEVNTEKSSGSAERRVGRKEKDFVSNILLHAYLDERITPLEYEERLEQVRLATTRRQLSATTNDLIPTFKTHLVTRNGSLLDSKSDFMVKKVQKNHPVLRKFLYAVSGIILTVTTLAWFSGVETNWINYANHAGEGLTQTVDVLAEEAQRTNEPFQVVDGEGLNSIQTVSGDALPNNVKAKIIESLNTEGLVIRGDVKKQTVVFVKKYPHLIAQPTEVVCNMIVNFQPGGLPTVECVKVK